MPNYYAFRTDRNVRDLIYSELQAGRLRQGWGWHPEQNLRNQTMDQGAAGNLKMLRVEKGDILLLPGLPSASEVLIAEATADWNAPEDEGGYRYEQLAARRGYGHIFPAKILKSFERHHAAVPSDIRRTLRTPTRFWSVNGYAAAIEELRNQQSALSERSLVADRVLDIALKAYADAFDVNSFRDQVFEQWHKNFGAAEWEEALVTGLSAAYPQYTVDRVGGPKEVEHGTDILIRIPRPLSDGSYGVAIQVKDHGGVVDHQAYVEQISKSAYWAAHEDLKIVEQVVLITSLDRSAAQDWVGNYPEVTFVFQDDLRELLVEYALAVRGEEGRLDYGPKG